MAFTGNFDGVPDGQPIEDDTDLSDGFAALNVAYGVEQATFSALENTTYTLRIYPYTNSGVNIDYKNDGNVPENTVTTGENVLNL